MAGLATFVALLLRTWLRASTQWGERGLSSPLGLCRRDGSVGSLEVFTLEMRTQMPERKESRGKGSFLALGPGFVSGCQTICCNYWLPRSKRLDSSPFPPPFNLALSMGDWPDSWGEPWVRVSTPGRWVSDGKTLGCRSLGACRGTRAWRLLTPALQLCGAVAPIRLRREERARPHQARLDRANAGGFTTREPHGLTSTAVKIAQPSKTLVAVKQLGWG